MGTWTWVLGGTPPSGVRRRELTRAYGRTITWRLDAACTAQFTIDGRADEAAEVEELATDLTIYRDGDKLFRGRIGPEFDDLGADTHTAQFSAVDYRGMLAYRQTGAAGAYYPPGTVGGALVLDLIADSQALTGGDWGVATGVGTASGTTREKTIDPGKPVLQSIEEVARLDGGFEWEIDADLELNLWHPTRGSDNGVVLDYGGLVSRAHRDLDPSAYANSVLVTGTDGLTPVTATEAGIATDQRGRWETSAGYPTIIEQATLNAKAPWLLAQRVTLRPQWTVTLRPGRWGGRSHIWLGDTCLLVVKSGRLDVAAAHRVTEVSVQPGENGTETVSLGLVAA